MCLLMVCLCIHTQTHTHINHDTITHAQKRTNKTDGDFGTHTHINVVFLGYL